MPLTAQESEQFWDVLWPRATSQSTKASEYQQIKLSASVYPLNTTLFLQYFQNVCLIASQISALGDHTDILYQLLTMSDKVVQEHTISNPCFKGFGHLLVFTNHDSSTNALKDVCKCYQHIPCSEQDYLMSRTEIYKMFFLNLNADCFYLH